jgi:Uma2 family endonuclease
VAGNATVRLDINNEPQPDALMIIRPGHGGRVVIGADDYIEGAPELVAEVAASTVSIDLHEKLQAYRRNQVQEYLVWRVENSVIDWFVLREREFVRLPLIAGVFRSEVFPGLWLDHDALVGDDSPRVLEILQEGLNSPEHEAFVQKLAAAEKELKLRGQA